MNIAYVLVQSTIGHEMEVLRDLLKFDIVKYNYNSFCNFRARESIIFS